MQLFSLISFAAISSVKGYSARSPLVYAMLIGLFIWYARRCTTHRNTCTRRFIFPEWRSQFLLSALPFLVCCCTVVRHNTSHFCTHTRLISMVLGVLLLMGWRDKLNPRLERLYYGVFTILWYVQLPVHIDTHECLLSIRQPPRQYMTKPLSCLSVCLCIVARTLCVCVFVTPASSNQLCCLHMCGIGDAGCGTDQSRGGFPILQHGTYRLLRILNTHVRCTKFTQLICRKVPM